MKNDSPDDRLHQLITRHLDGCLPADGQDELAKLLAASPAARGLLARYMRLEGATWQLARAAAVSHPHSNRDSDPIDAASHGLVESAARETTPGGFLGNASSGAKAPWRVPSWILAATAAGLLVAGGLYLSTNKRQVVSGPPLACVTRAVAVQWRQSAPEIGQQLRARRLLLEDGIAEIEFASGATVILEGPADFELVSDMRGYLRAGRVRGFVPPEAFGFSIASPSLTIVDFGTEFGLQVDATGFGELHVFDGGVEFQSPLQTQPVSLTKHILLAGEAIRFDAMGLQGAMEADQDAFVDSELLEVRAEAYVQDLMEMVGKLRQDQLEADRAIKLRKTQVRKDKMMAKLRQEIEGARREFKKAAAELPEMTKAQSRQQEAKVQYEEVLARKVNEDETGNAAVQRRQELTLRVAELTKSLRKMRGKEAAEDRRRIHIALRRAETELKTKESSLRKLRQNLRKQDNQVQMAWKEYVKERRIAEKIGQNKQLKQLQQNLADKQRALAQFQHQLLRDDQLLSSLRNEQKQIKDELRRLRGEIGRARRIIVVAEDESEPPSGMRAEPPTV